MIDYIPHFLQYSLNIRGLVSQKCRKNKMSWLKQQLKEIKKLGVIHFQESHFSNLGEIEECFFGMKGKILGVSCNPTNHKQGVFSWVPLESPIYDLIHDHDSGTQGRWATMRVTSVHEELHLANVYFPSDCKLSREDFFTQIKEDLDLPHLIVGGDWNFCSSNLDKLIDGDFTQPRHHPKCEDYFIDLDLEDVYRHYNEESSEMTFIHVDGRYMARLDRFYAQTDLLEFISPIPTIFVMKDISDHQMVGMSFKDDEVIEKIEEHHYRLSKPMLKALTNKESNVHKMIIEIFNEATEWYENLVAQGEEWASHVTWDLLKLTIRNELKEIDEAYRNRRKLRLKKAIQTLQMDELITAHSSDIPDIIQAKKEAMEEIRMDQQRVIQNIKAASDFNWIRDGEHSNKLFFMQTKARVKQNRIPDLRLPNGNLTSDSKSKKKVASDSYAETFSKRIPDPIALQEVVDSLIQANKKLSSEEKNTIESFTNLESLDLGEEEDISKDWLFQTIESLKMYKAPGPDGLPNDFYYIFRDNCNMLNLLRQVFKDSLARGSLPSSMKTTYYKLLYKKGYYSKQELDSGVLDGTSKDPRNLGNWRPIALLPCDSKILSAYFANKLKTCLDNLISKSQSAFIPGRSIHDNIMLIQQMIHYHNETNTKGGMVFVDFSHAYDYISQEYILKVLETMNFPQNFIDLVATLMNEQKGRVLVNGDLSPEFEVNNGGKQGDPLFPLIYIIALEGMVSLLEQDPTYTGIKPPYSDKRLSSSGFADDTCLFVSDKLADRIAIERMLICFQKASGNEVKLAKSFIIWLGPWKGILDHIYGIHPLIGNERYLGLQIASEFDSSLNWKNIIDRLPACTEYWSTLGLSIFGRTLMINSSLLSKLWFVAMHTPHTTEIVKSIDKLVNNYFRKGKRFTSMSHSLRVTPTYYGGLGQLDVQTQLNNLLAKWAIRSLSNDPHPWNLYWKWNVVQLQIHLKTHTHPAFYKCNWNLKRSPTHLFHLTIPVYKAWHSIDLKLKFNFNSISAMPLFHNKFITDHDDKAVVMARYTRKVLAELDDQGKELLIGDMYKEVIPTPHTNFSYEDPNTHRMIKLTSNQIKAKFESDIDGSHWNSILLKVPEETHKAMVTGCDLPHLEGWFAREVMTLDDPIGDIYYKTTDNNNKVSLHYFEFAIDDSHLRLVSSSSANSPDWLEWETNILPNLRPLKVTCISGLPFLNGWADRTLNMIDFIVPKKDQSDDKIKLVELTICSANYTNISSNPTKYHKPQYNTLFRSIRKANSDFIEYLQRWPPSPEEIKNHDDRPPPVKVNWKERLKRLRNCTFLGPKYRQLIYQITTNSVIDGARLHKTNPLRGLCPHCGTIASTQHMLADCVAVKSIWRVIDKLGNAHWDDYEPLVYDLIPDILRSYDPINLYHVSALWAFWVIWCKHFYDTDPVEDWKVEILTKFKEQFYKRIAEAPSMTQWIKLAQSRRTESEDDSDNPIKSVSEKDFLMIHTQSIRTNTPHLICGDEGPDPNIMKWIGKGHLVTIDYDALNGNKPRLRLDHIPWKNFVHPEDPLAPPPSGWVASLPLSVIGS